MMETIICDFKIEGLNKDLIPNTTALMEYNKEQNAFIIKVFKDSEKIPMTMLYLDDITSSLSNILRHMAIK